MAGRKGTFAFDLSHPVKKGVLLKQGAFHKAFKYRFFLVYPGFLVYYDQESKWLLDLTKGETLGGRLGAIKLKGGSCNVARDAPKACKFGFIVHAPDPLNKRPTYLINAHSKQDRDEWIEAIRKALPTSPRQQRKNEGSPKRMKEEPKNTYSDPPPPYPHPTTTVRQDTAAVAATVATENERVNGVDESITSIDDSLHDQPTMDVRRDTAATAALSLSYKKEKQEDNNQTENDQLTNIDDILGPREANTDKESDTSDESSQRTETPSDSNSIQAQSPEPDAVPLVNNNEDEDSKTEESENAVEEAKKEDEGERSESNPPPAMEEAKKESEGERSESNAPPAVESSGVVEDLQTNTQDGEDVVVTTVTVEVNRESPVAVCDETECTIKNKSDAEKEEKEGEGTNTSKDEQGESQGEAKTEASETKTEERNGVSTLAVEKVPTKGGEGDGESEEGEGVEVLITHDQRSNSFSINVANVDTDDYSSSEDESPQPPPYVEPPTESEGAATTSSSTAEEAKATPTQEVTSSEEPPKANGEFPTITVEKAEGEKNEEGKEKRTGSESSSEGERLSPPVERRRSSQPFIEKKGFLYKMGGKRKNWNLRYFVLRPGVFTYAKNPSSKILGEVKLKNLQVFFPGLGERKTSFQFTIHTESTWNKRMDWVLAAQSEREMKDWIQAFKLAGQKNMPSPATSDNELESST